MLTLSAKVRKDLGKKVETLRRKGFLPAVLYGPKIKNLSLIIDEKEFDKIFQEAGESSLVSLDVEGDKKYLVLIHDFQRDPLTDKIIHVDFFQPSLKEEIEVKIPLVFEGEAPAVKSLGGTFVKYLSEIEVKVLPQKLPREIRVSVEGLKSFEDNIKIADLKLPEGVKILRDKEEIIAAVLPAEKVEEELVKPVEEKVEEVEKVEEKKEKETFEEE